MGAKMHTTSLSIFASSTVAAKHFVWENLREMYHLPSIYMLWEGMNKRISWEGVSPEIRIDYLEPLRDETPQQTVFQIRYKSALENRHLISMHISIEPDSKIHSMAWTFPKYGDRGCSSKIIGWMKEHSKIEGMKDLYQFEICGVAERGGLRHVNERSLSAFVYCEQIGGRYLHVTDDINQVREVKKFQ